MIWRENSLNPLFLVIPISLPLLGGLVMLVKPINHMMTRRIWCEAVACVTSVCVWIALVQVRHEPVTVYSFTRGFSVNFCVDGMATLFALMVSVMWPLVLLYAFEYMRGDENRNRFFAFYLMTYGITLGVCFASDMITMYLFFEMLTLVTIPLVVHYESHESMYAGRKYAAYTIGGASLGLMAVVLTTISGQAGEFLYGGSISGSYDPRMMQLAFVLAFFGFGAKAAIFPLHDWLPVASVAPTPVTALLHAVAVVNSGVFAVLRMTYFVFGTDFLRGTPAQAVCVAAATFSLLFGAVQAIRERHFKRRLAYSTMSNLSYMLLGAMAMTPLGLAAALAHMLFHGIVKIVLFMCAGAFMHQAHKSYIYEINGVGKKMPVTFATYTLCAMSLTGIPLFCGFVSKWQLLTACSQSAAAFAKEAAAGAAGAAASGAVGTAVGAAGGIAGAARLTALLPVILKWLLYAGDAALIASAFMCAMYTLTISVRAFFTTEDKDLYRDSKVSEAGILILIPICFFCALNILFGVVPGPLLSFLNAIGRGIM